MSEISPTHTPSVASRRSVVWAIVLGIVLVIVAVLVAGIGIFTGILAFNGCMANKGPFLSTMGMVWLLGVWPLSLLATALVPPILLGSGRGVKLALLAFVIGCLISFCVLVAYLPIGYAALC